MPNSLFWKDIFVPALGFCFIWAESPPIWPVLWHIISWSCFLGEVHYSSLPIWGKCWRDNHMHKLWTMKNVLLIILMHHSKIGRFFGIWSPFSCSLWTQIEWVACRFWYSSPLLSPTPFQEKTTKFTLIFAFKLLLFPLQVLLLSFQFGNTNVHINWS